jgi:hypothetical protein
MMKKLLLVGLGSALMLQANAQEAARVKTALHDGQKMSNQSIVKRSPISKSTTSALNITPVTIGSSVNAFTQVGHNRRRVSANQDLNAVLFVHRGDAAVTGQSGNMTVYDYSTDGGATWTANAGPVIQSGLVATFPGTRYPQGYLYNPAGNTTVANARVIANGAHATGENNSWGTLTVGSSKLDGTSQNARVFNAGGAFIPQSMTERIPGEYWMVDDTTVDGNISLYKGVYSVAGDSVVWTQQSLGKATSLFDTSVDGSMHYYDVWVGFSPDGNTGWAAVNGEIAGAAPDTATYPIFWKSTDGGATWGTPEAVRLKNLAGVIADFGSLMPTTAFDAALTVDKNGNPHFMFVAGPAASTPYSIGTGITLPIYDITLDAGAWVANWVDTVQAFRGTPAGTTLSQDNAPSISRSADGSKIFYTWVDTKLENQTSNGDNGFPDLYLKGFDVDAKSFGPKVNVTEGSSVESIVYLPAVATIATNAGTDYKIHSVITSFTADENVQVNFTYLDGVIYSFVGVNNTKNDLFEVTGNYPNPFSGNTSFDLSLTKSSDVKVTVTNLLGQVISSEVSSLSAGKHTLNINAEGLSSGIYMFTVNAGGFEVTNKMIVK